MRLFIGVWPNDEVVEQLRGLPRKDRPGIRWVPPENWHTTLRFLGDADPDEVVDALDQSSLPAAHARYGPGVDLAFDKVVVVPAHGLDELAHAITRATGGIGSQRPPRRFAGHLTVARLRRRGWIPAVIGAPIVADHPVEEVALVASTLRPTGAEYTTIATWPTGRHRG